jgi:hypothetical protein
MEQVSNDQASAGTGFDRGAAVTRSLLGYGVIAGPIYLVVGLVQAFARDGFDFTRHGLSLLANGPWGWVQVVNFIVTGLMVLAAAAGFARAMRPASAAAALIAVYGGGLVLSGVFVADPMDGFPPGTPDGAPESMSLAGTLHLAAGGLGFLALAVAYFVLGRWFARRDQAGLARGSWASGAVVLAGFALGAATATTALGVAALWIAVVAGWGWLAVASLAVYRTVPHPDLHRRT